MYGFILDLDGTLYAGTRSIPGAVEFVAALRERGWPYVFATNNSSRTPEQVAKHLRAVTGVPAEPDQVLTTAQAAAAHIAGELGGGGKRVFAVGEAGLRQALQEAGLMLAGADEDRVDFVVQGIDRAFDYAKLSAAVRYISAGAPFVLTNPDRQLPTESGFQPGAGSLGASIEAASGVQPILIGKPSKVMMDQAVRRLGLTPDRIWAVGDNLRTDIAGGLAAGCRTALVLTGVASRSNVDAQIALTGATPELVCDDLPALLDALR